MKFIKMFVIAIASAGCFSLAVAARASAVDLTYPSIGGIPADSQGNFLSFLNTLGANQGGSTSAPTGDFLTSLSTFGANQGGSTAASAGDFFKFLSTLGANQGGSTSAPSGDFLNLLSTLGANQGGSSASTGTTSVSSQGNFFGSIGGTGTSTSQSDGSPTVQFSPLTGNIDVSALFNTNASDAQSGFLKLFNQGVFGGTTPNQAFFSPSSGITFDSTGNIYLGDLGNESVLKLTPDSELQLGRLVQVNAQAASVPEPSMTAGLVGSAIGIWWLQRQRHLQATKVAVQGASNRKG